MKTRARFPSLLSLLPLLLLPLLGGCSLFGVATKGELETAQQENRSRQELILKRSQQLQQQLGDLTRELKTVRDRLGDQSESLKMALDDAELDRNVLADKVTGVQKQIASVEGGLRRDVDVMAASLDSVDHSVDDVRGDLADVDRQVDLVAQDLDGVSDVAQDAQQRSSEVLRVYYENLKLERRRLMQQLAELEEALAVFDRIQDQAPAPGELTPEEGEKSPAAAEEDRLSDLRSEP